MKKGQQIRELPMRRCVLTFAGAVEGLFSVVLVCVLLVFRLTLGARPFVNSLVMAKDKTTVNERLQAGNENGKITYDAFLCLCSTSFFSGTGAQCLKL